MILAGLTMELLGRMSRSTKAPGARPPWLRAVVDYVRGHLSEPSSLAAVAGAVGVHPAHLSRVFRKHYGCTIGEYSRTLRLDRACAALLEHDRPLEDVVLEAGFSDQSHFSRAFKAHTGLTPGQYRRLIPASQFRYKKMQL